MKTTKKSLFESVLNRLSTIAPLYGKVLMNAGLRKRGKTPENVTAIDVLEILQEEIKIPDMDTSGTTSILLQTANSGYVITDNQNHVIYADSYIKKLVQKIKKQDISFEALKELGLSNDCKNTSSFKIQQIHLGESGQTFNVTLIPVFNQTQIMTHLVSLIQDVTLNSELEKEVLEQNHLLKEEIKARKEAETELLKNQQMMAHNARLISLAEMAAGIAHEINNPLAIVESSLSLIELSKNKTDESGLKTHKNAMKNAKNALERMRKTIQSMRKLARSDATPDFTTEKVGPILDEMLHLCRDRLKQNEIELIIENHEGEHLTPLKHVEVGQVLVNLISNSIDAVSELSPKWIKIVIQPENEWLRISVIDSGSGISTEIQEKIFQPFFTTKEVGKGTGLGMSISKRIIDQHSGRMRIDPGSPNTKIDIYLPSAKKKAAA